MVEQSNDSADINILFCEIKLYMDVIFLLLNDYHTQKYSNLFMP